MRKRLNKGLIQVYFGRGKGKTTAALGQAFRACGHGFKVYMIQFMKKNVKYGELNSAKKHENFTIEQFGRADLVSEPEEIDIIEGKKALDRARKIISSDDWDIVILDEIGVAIEMNIVTIEDTLEIINNRPEKVEIILTGGPGMHPKLKMIADLVSEIKIVKHYYSKGINARYGIEY